MSNNKLPEKWKIKRINEIIYKTNQIDPKKTPQKDIKYIDVSSISNETFKIVDFKVYKGENAPNRAKKIIKTNDIIFATIRPYLKRIAIVDKEFHDELCSTAFCVLRPKKEVLHFEFLYYFLLTDLFVNRVSEKQKGSSYPAVTDKTIKTMEIPLPPLDEQKKIAHVLSLVQEAKERTEAVIAAAKELKASMMKHLFTYGPVPPAEADKVKLKETEIGPIPEEWEVIELKKGLLCTTQINPKENPDGLIKYIDVSSLSSDLLKVTQFKEYLGKNAPGRARKLVKTNDIIFATIRPYLKRIALISEELNNELCSTAFCVIRTEKSVLDHKYLFYYLITDSFVERISAQQSGSSYPAVNDKVIKKAKIPKPDLISQKEIAGILAAIDDKIEGEEGKRRALEGLFKSLLEHLMTGKIRVNHLEIEE